MWKHKANSDIHSTKLWNKYIAHVIQREKKVGITISPPKGMNQESCILITTIVQHIIQFSHTEAYFILESDKEGRWHWHGMLGFTKFQLNMGFDRTVMDQIKTELTGKAFVDFQTPLRSVGAWINYTLKDVQFEDGQDKHYKMGYFPVCPRFDFHEVPEDYSKTLLADPDVIALINEPRAVDGDIPE